jgi:protein-S-isoprenylcysteine O-methyltransferase Ste14
MSRYLQWSRREHPESTRIAVLVLLGPVFLGLLPALVAGVGPRLDRALGSRLGRKLGRGPGRGPGRRPPGGGEGTVATGTAGVAASTAGVAATRILGGLLAVAGFGLGLWSVQAQLDRGRGTPLPVMPTQELLTDGPFRYCRNPMTLGAILAYLGIAIAARTPSGIGLVSTLAGVLLAYLKCLEEPELAERFGEAYADYKRTTPFIVPRLR